MMSVAVDGAKTTGAVAPGSTTPGGVFAQILRALAPRSKKQGRARAGQVNRGSPRSAGGFRSLDELLQILRDNEAKQ